MKIGTGKMKKKIKAIIVGAGIGGLALARAFEKIEMDYVVLNVHFLC